MTNKVPTDIASKSAIIINIIDGGIKILNVPDAAIVPVERDFIVVSKFQYDRKQEESS